jgi:hypothetical protein
LLAACANAALRGGGAQVRPLLLAEAILNCTIPALVNSSVGSLPGTSGLEDDGVTLTLEIAEKRLRISLLVMDCMSVGSQNSTGANPAVT